MAGQGRIVVVGAGVMGGWTAFWLRRRGLAVTLVDQYGPGSSLATSGDETRVTRSAHGSDDLYPRWQRLALDQWRLLEEEAHVRLVVPTGVVWFVHRDDGFEGVSLATLARLDIPAERLEVAEAARRWPQIAFDGIAWVLHEPEAAVVMARRAMLALADLFVRDGGIVERGRVLPLDETDGAGGRLHRLRVADGRQLSADAFVLAVGPWLPRLLPDVSALQLEITRQELVYFATPPGDGRFDAGVLPTWVDYEGAFYGLPSIEGRGLKVAPDWPGAVVDPDREERRLSDERVAAARDYVRRRFPAMGEQPVAEGRICQYETTPDTHFIIDRHPGWENAWVVGGGSGHGFKHGPSIGEYLSALVIGDEDAAVGLAPSDERFGLRPRSSGHGMRTSGAPPED
ncbi:MAG: FAD-dependent oxidoreductase [Candidatus Limnocylindria bacterium]